MSSVPIQLIVLAGIAIFLILKLRSVLGTREGFEQPATGPSLRPVPGGQVIEGSLDHDIVDNVEDESSRSALSAMKGAEPEFSVTEFLKGARAAYEMILMAFDKGEIDRIRPFIGDEVEHSFDAAVADRVKRGLTVTSSFVGVREMTLAEAEFDPVTKRAEISVRFMGEVIRAVRDETGTVVEGNATAVQRQRETWTFSRVMGAGDPNWQLTATSD
ncbi:Tim44/TimA family putative adaptor protein [bacterium]|nr:Tim44/TimA family putative adaptor protein [bacterium]